MPLARRRETGPSHEVRPFDAPDHTWRCHARCQPEPDAATVLGPIPHVALGRSAHEDTHRQASSFPVENRTDIWDIWGHPQFPLATGQTTPTLVHLTIMTLAGSTSDRAKASRADVEHPIMARRNRAEVVVAEEIGVYHCVQRVVRRAFLCGVDPLSGNS